MTGPAVPSDEELREALARYLVALYGQLLRPPNDMGDGSRDAAYLLSRPEMAALLDAAEKVRRMEALHKPVMNWTAPLPIGNPDEALDGQP